MAKKKFKIEYVQNGQKKFFEMAAENVSSARASANKRQIGRIMRISEVQVDNTISPLAKLMQVIRFKSNRIKMQHIIASINQLSVMSSAGISIHDSVREVSNSSDNKRVKEIFDKCYDDLNSGQSLSASLESNRKELGDIVLAMVRLGESTGNLGESLKKLAEILQELHDNRQKFKKAMRYPIIVVTAIAIAFSILMLYVVPKFKDIFEQLDAKLPLPTIIMLKIESLLSNYGIFVLAGIIGAIFAHKYAYAKRPEYAKVCDRIVLKIYLIGKIIHYASMSRFNLIFTELVRAGIPIAEALETSVQTISNDTIKTNLMATRVGISRGMSLTDSLAETQLYENMLIQMIKAGEASGQLDAMLSRVTDYYKERFNNIIDNLSSYIEPILMAFIAVMVLFLALGIFLPMWDMGSAVRS